MTAATTYPHPVGDLEPPLELQMRQRAAAGDAGATRGPDGIWRKPVDLSTAEKVTAYIKPVDDVARTPLLVRDFVIVDPPLGKIRLVWQAGDPVETGGLYVVWARIQWPGVRPQTAPGRPEDRFLLRVFQQQV